MAAPQPPGPTPFFAPFSNAQFATTTAAFDADPARQYPVPAASASNTPGNGLSSSSSMTATRQPAFSASIGRKRRAASPTGAGLDGLFDFDFNGENGADAGHGGSGHGAKRRRPNLAHGFSGLSISPETQIRRNGPIPMPAQPKEEEEEAEVVDDDDALLPHERELLIEDLGEASEANPAHRHHRAQQHQAAWPYQHQHKNQQARPRHPPRQFSASNPSSLHRQSSNANKGKGRPASGVGIGAYDDSSSPSEQSDAEDENDVDNPYGSASQSPYMSRRPTIQADEVELPDAETDAPSGHREGRKGAYGYRSDGNGSVNGLEDVQVEELSESPEKEQAQPFQFDFSPSVRHGHAHGHHRPLPTAHGPAHTHTHAYTPASSSSKRRGLKRRTSSVSSEGDARQKKSRGMSGLEGGDGMDMDDELDMGPGGVAPGVNASGADWGNPSMDMAMDTGSFTEAKEGRETRGRSRARERRRGGKKGNGWYEPEKDRIIYTSLSSSPSRSRSRSASRSDTASRSRSRSRSSSPPIEISTSSLPPLSDLSQPGTRGFTISPSMLTRLLAAQRDAQHSQISGGGGGGGGGSGGTANIKINRRSFPFDLNTLRHESMKGMGERGLVLYRPLGIPAGLPNQAQAQAQAQAQGQGGAGWEETVKRWAAGQTVPFTDRSQEDERTRFEEVGEDELVHGHGAGAGDVHVSVDGVGDGDVDLDADTGAPNGWTSSRVEPVGSTSGDGDIEME